MYDQQKVVELPFRFGIVIAILVSSFIQFLYFIFQSELSPCNGIGPVFCLLFEWLDYSVLLL